MMTLAHTTTTTHKQGLILAALAPKALTYVELKRATGLRLGFHDTLDSLLLTEAVTQTVTGRYRTPHTPAETVDELLAIIVQQNALITDLMSVRLDTQARHDASQRTLATLSQAWKVVESLMPGHAKQDAQRRLESLLRQIPVPRKTPDQAPF